MGYTDDLLSFSIRQVCDFVSNPKLKWRTNYTVSYTDGKLILLNISKYM